jgi:pentatricopeptide repeat protein
VDFEHGYQYGAWVKAMVDLKLIRADKRNGTAIIRFVNKTFGEQIDKTTLFRCLTKEGDFEKIRDLYEGILSVIRQEMERDSRLNGLKNALKTV